MTTEKINGLKTEKDTRKQKIRKALTKMRRKKCEWQTTNQWT